MAIHASSTTLIVLLPLMAWRMHARYRRLVGRQRTSRYRPWITGGIYAVLLSLLSWSAWGQWPALASLAGGLVCGGLLSRWAWSRTQLEPTPQGLYYTPHTHLGIALSLLFVARITWRVVELVWLSPDAGFSLHGFVASPLTLAVFGLMAGHSTGYALSLFRWRQRVLAARHLRQAGAPSEEHAPR